MTILLKDLDDLGVIEKDLILKRVFDAIDATEPQAAASVSARDRGFVDTLRAVARPLDGRRPILHALSRMHNPGDTGLGISEHQPSHKS